MIRLIVYIAISLGLTAGVAWLISLPGTITVEAAGYRMQPGLGVAALICIGVIIAIIVIWAIIRHILQAPKRLARAARQRRQELGVGALSDGFIALEAGDLKQAKQMAREAQNRLPQNAAAQLLQARAELGLGELGPAREHYRALISNPKTALAALSGLYEQAHAQNRKDVALTFARKAVEMTKSVGSPTAIGWARTALFEDLTANGDWQGALDMVNNEPTSNRLSRSEKRRKRAVLTTALAAETETSDPVNALAQAHAALKLEPDFVPAALIAARIHINRGEPRKAQSLLRRVWRTTAHPHIALLFANAQPGTSTQDRLKRTKDLVGTSPDDLAGSMVLARAAIDAQEWATAHNALANFSASNPSTGVCALMAELEQGENNDEGKARQWLARAVRAPRDPAWIADGIIAEEWEPTSPISRKLDAFKWATPPISKTTVQSSLTAEPAPALTATKSTEDSASEQPALSTKPDPSTPTETAPAPKT